MFGIIELGCKGGAILDYRQENKCKPGDHQAVLDWMFAARNELKINHPGIEIYSRMVSNWEMLTLLGHSRNKSATHT